MRTIIIPARLASKRLPNKPIIQIHGKPLICYAIENASKSYADRIVVAAEDKKIIDTIYEYYHGKLPPKLTDMIMTPKAKSGTDRIIQVCNKYKLHNDTIINLQCDEPLLRQEIINTLLSSEHQVATIATEIDQSDYFCDSCVKVVTDIYGFAMYFSRSPIPHNSEHPLKHIGIYKYDGRMIDKLEVHDKNLECEKLEQLHWLSNGIDIYVHKINKTSDIVSVDTPNDLERVKSIIENQYHKP